MNIFEVYKPKPRKYAYSFHQEGRKSMDEALLKKVMAFCKNEAKERETHNNIQQRD